jgi:hypothetical protein
MSWAPERSIGSATESEEARSAEAIRRDIERRRESIARTVDQAGQKLHHTFDWRAQVLERPYTAVAVVAGAGWLLTRLLRPGPTASHRLADGLTVSIQEIARSLQQSFGGPPRPRHALRRAVGTALTAIVTQSVAGTVRDHVAPINERRER